MMSLTLKHLRFFCFYSFLIVMYQMNNWHNPNNLNNQFSNTSMNSEKETTTQEGLHAIKELIEGSPTSAVEFALKHDLSSEYDVDIKSIGEYTYKGAFEVDARHTYPDRQSLIKAISEFLLDK